MFKKKNKEIVVGSNNHGKIKEIKDLLPKYYIITSPKDYGLKSPKENGNTFLKNSLIKAKYFSKKTKKICIAVYGLKKNPIQSLGVINGRISKKKIGNKGFGYDPIFIPENKRLTFGQMSQKLKFKNDHRAKAFKKIKKFL